MWWYTYFVLFDVALIGLALYGLYRVSRRKK